MTPEERFERIEANLEASGLRLARIEQSLDKHIEFVGASLTRLELQVAETGKQVARTSAAQEVTEKRLQELIGKVDDVEDRVGRLEKKDRPS